MWFTRVSIQNPVFATMLMLALVVLGLFSLQRLKVDQFPNIDFPVVVVITDYPGASPEIVESEVSKKIEEGVNSIAGISALTSRSYENQSVVVIEFGLHIDGRKAADDVREKVAAIKPNLRAEVKEPRVLRFDPSARSIWSVAVLPDVAPTLPTACGSLPPEGANFSRGGPSVNCAPTLPTACGSLPPEGANSSRGGPSKNCPDQGNAARAMSNIELTNWAEQVFKKRLENVRGVGSVTVVGGAKREINIYLNPLALESFGITPEQVVAAVRNENQDLPLGAIRSTEQEKIIQIDARMQRPEDFGKIIVARKNGTPVRVEQVAKVADGAQEIETLALYNGQRRCC
jgi:hydrophobic/amphiphilic exporter-1 (mainly G- bacteria), HAE1 family